MGIIIVFVFIIALPMLLLSKSKISKRQKILWPVCIFISLVFLAMYILIQGFEREETLKDLQKNSISLQSRFLFIF